MKYPALVLAVLLALITGVSCMDDNDPSPEEICSTALTDLAASASFWATSSANQTEASCNTFKADLLKVLNNCNTEDYWPLYGGEDGWMDFVSDIESLDCTLFP